MKAAEQPFEFHTVSYLTRVSNHKAANLCDLRKGIEESSDVSIFYHTFQSLGRHHFLTEGFSNDFAQWVLAACNEARLAEALAALDIRDYTSLADLRRDLVALVGEYCDTHPQESARRAFEPFYFCESVEVASLLGLQARTLEEFRRGVEHLSHASLHYHFISSRLRLHLRTNDFSLWLASALGLERLAASVNRIDIYTNTLESARDKLLELVDRFTGNGSP